MTSDGGWPSRIHFVSPHIRTVIINGHVWAEVRVGEIGVCVRCLVCVGVCCVCVGCEYWYVCLCLVFVCVCVCVCDLCVSVCLSVIHS